MRNQLLWVFLLLFLFGCSRKNIPELPAGSNITGLASAVVLQPEGTWIYLSDYVTDPGVIDGLRIAGYADTLYYREDDRLYVISAEGMDPITGLEITAGGITETVPLFRSEKTLVGFTYNPQGKACSDVSVRGEFNGWTAGRPAFELAGGQWKGQMMLSPGTYQYLLVVDGEDMLDPSNPDKIDNNLGGYNSLLTVGAGIEDNLPRAFTLQHKKDHVIIGFEGEVKDIFASWQNVRLPSDYYYKDETGKYEIVIPEAAEAVKRSFLRVWLWNDHGRSNDLLIPLDHGRVIDDASLLSRHDHHGMILYNVFVDRFYDAYTGNNRPLDRPDVLPPADYNGGDIQGVTQKIRDGYFDELGVNTIWISPVVKNPEGAYGYWPDPPSKFSGYHGYWPVSFTLVDDRFGTEDDLHGLVSIAHEHNMNVLLDFVANHVHQDHPVYQANPGWATELYLPDGTLNTERWDEYRLTTWFDVFLPTLDLSRPEVYEMLSDSAVYWIHKFKLDGFRHDATKHIPEVFWRTLTRKLKEDVVAGEGRPVYQIGETYGGPELIGSYVGSGMLDAQFDFNVYDDALAVLIRPDQPFSRLEASLRESLRYYGAHNLMGYISGNQDRGRFTSYAGGALLFDEDAKLAGWKRDVTVGDPRGYQVTALLFAFNMTIPGLPVIYYGDEIGMPGGNDPDNRRMMRFDGLTPDERSLIEKVKKLAALRQSSLPLIFGDFATLHLTDDTWAYARTYFDEMVIVVMNKSAEPKNITFALPERFSGYEFASQFVTSPSVRSGVMSITLGGGSFGVIGFQP